MKKILAIFLLVFGSTVVLSGCINPKTGDINVDQAQKVQEAINKVTKILSPEEYRALIDLEIAELAREKLLSTSTESLSESAVLEIENEINRIKNNCNLKFDESVVLSNTLQDNFDKGYVCKYIKGSATQSSQRVDEFSLKYFKSQPFEFGVSGSLEYRTSNALLVLEDQTGDSLIEQKGEIFTIVGKIYFDEIVKTTPSGSSASPISESPSNTTVQVSEPNSNIKLFLAILGDGGQKGKVVGCGDSLVSAGVNLSFPNSNLNDKIEFALEYLFRLDEYEYNKDQGLVNPLYNSDLRIKSLSISGGKAVLKLDGDLNLKGICDYPIAAAQIEELIRQFSGVSEVELIFNELEEEDIF